MTSNRVGLSAQSTSAPPKSTSAAPRSLVAVAFLKARFDEGVDHLEMFMPLVIDSIEGRSGQTFTASELQDVLIASHGLAIPQHTLSTLLGRCVKRRLIRREANRYIASDSAPAVEVDIHAEKLRILRAQALLGAGLRAHAEARGLTIANDDRALALILELMELQQVSLLLDGPPPHTTHASHREISVAAEFVRNALTNDPEHRATLMAILQGMVLYRAAFLPDLAEVKRQFTSLRIYVDSGLVREALGYEGLGPQELARETFRILKESGVQCLVFEKTVQEIRRILSMFERKLATGDGRRSLHPSPMTRHFLTNRYRPSDVAQMDALLERTISGLGLQVAPSPQHVPEFTLDERDLAERLAKRDVEDDDTSPRVIHDVDAVAAVLTLRKGHRPSKLEDSRALFVSSTSIVVKKTQAWFKDQGGVGTPPIVHIRTLSNLAWLKRPAIMMEFKMREAIVLCSAALRPSRETWDRFLRHLDELRQSATITSDEAAAIVISELSDRLLGEVELLDDTTEDGPDAHTMDDVIAKVKAAYAADARSRVVEVEAERDAIVAAAELERDAERVAAEARANELSHQLRSEMERTKERDNQLEERSRSFAKRVAAWMYWILVLLVLTGGGALILGHGLHTGVIGVMTGLAIVVFMVLELVGILEHVKHLRKRLENGVAKRYRRWLSGEGEDWDQM